jgi:6-phosphogluconate dehydrogenase
MRNRASAKLPADERYDLNLADIAEVWRRGSVVTSWAARPHGQRARPRRAS